MPLGVEVGLGPGHSVLDGDQATLTERGTATPHFSVDGFVAKRSPISATAELLYCFIRLIVQCMSKLQMPTVNKLKMNGWIDLQINYSFTNQVNYKMSDALECITCS